MSGISSKQTWSVCLGNLFEHYDKALFGYLSPFLAPLIFPNQEPITALILTYAILPLSMIAKPIGALLLGHLADTHSQKRALLVSLSSMALVSCLMACIPLRTGWAPFLFCFGRAIQSFLVAGTTMGGALFLLANSPEKERDLFSGLFSASGMGGHLLASFGVVFVTSYLRFDLGWRALYLFGGATALFGYLLRSPVEMRGSRETLKGSVRALFLNYKPLLAIILTAGFAHATYSVAIVLMNGFIPLVSPLTKQEIMKLNTALLLFDFCALPLFGWVASKVSREKLMLWMSSGAFLLAIPLLSALQGASMGVVIAVRIALIILGVAFFAPFHSWAQGLVTSERRCTLISVGYALGCQLLGAPTAAISLWLFQKSGSVVGAALYWMALAGASAVAIALATRVKPRAPLQHPQSRSQQHFDASDRRTL